MIVITGATGTLGGAIVDHLLEAVPAAEIAVGARNAARAQRFADCGVAVRQCDYADPGSLPGAFDGADQLLLVSASDPDTDAVRLQRTVIDAAVTAGVGRIVYTSHQGAALESPFGPCRDHAATEKLLADSGVPWTALRNGFYAHSLGWLMGPWRESGVITVPADGPVSWTARLDLAEAAAAIIASDGAYDGPITLTAAAAPTFKDIAAIASGLSGRTIACEIIDPDEWIAAQIAAGQQEFLARFTLGVYQAAQGGFFAGVDRTLAALLGREPQTVRDVLTETGA